MISLAAGGARAKLERKGASNAHQNSSFLEAITISNKQFKIMLDETVIVLFLSKNNT